MGIKQWTPSGEIEKRTYDEVLQGLHEVVATKPANYVYSAEDLGGTCRYWDRNDDCPSCMIGVYLHSIGYGAGVLQELDELIDPAWSANPEGLHEGFTDKANDLMKTAQHHQDTGSTWTESLNRAQQDVEDPPVYMASNRVYNDNEERI